MQKITVAWISAGVSSFIASYLLKDEIDDFIYIDISDQHPDSIRFIKDCEQALGREIKILTSENYRSVEDVCRANKFICSPSGCKCTQILKKRVRKKWEYEHRDYEITYIWGFDCTETKRAERLVESMPEFNHKFPLIDKGLTKEDCHGICVNRLHIKRPIMYDLGYSNNNCIGCLKGGKGYWNKIRVDFPEVFNKRAKMERDIGISILREGEKKLFLDELDPGAGRISEEIMDECSIFCMMTGIGGE